MAQDSIAYGESLLADIRQRNDKLRSQAKKEQKRNLWKAAAVKIGTEVVSDIFTQRQNNFLNNEENLANKLRTTTALNESTRYTTADKTAKAFLGGETAYWETQAAPQVDSYLKATYADGTYNQNEYDLFKNQLSKKWSQQLYKEHQEGLKLTQDFLSAGGGEEDAYVNSIKRSRGTGIVGGIANWVGKGTGVLKADVHNSTSKLLETSDKLTQYKSAYEGTGDSALSAFIAEQDLLKGVDLGRKGPTFGTPTMQKTDFGGEVAVIPMTTYDEKGRVESLTMISADASGKFNFDTSETSTQRKGFSLLSSQIATSTNKTYLDAGKKALMGIEGDKSGELTEAFEEIVREARKRDTSKTGQEMMLSLNETVSSKAGAIIYRAKNEGWATSSEASIIAGEMVADAYIEGNHHRVLFDAGLGNPYHTMFAIESAINNKKINNSDGIGQLGGSENLMNLYQAYRTETSEGRSVLDAKLEANNYFEGKTGPLFGNVHKTIKSVINKGIEGTEENLIREYNNLFNRKPNTISTAVEDEQESEVIDMASLPVPAPADERGIITADTRRQMRAYKKLMELDKKIKVRNEKISYFSEEDTYNKGAIVNISKALEKEQNRFNNLYANYMNKYGSTEE